MAEKTITEQVVLLSELEEAIKDIPYDTVLGEEMVYLSDVDSLISGGWCGLHVYEAEIILDEE